MKRYSITLLCSAIFSFSLIGQSINLEWVRQLNSVAASSAATGTDLRSNGNIVVKGFYKQKIDLEMDNIVSDSEPNGDGYMIEFGPDGSFNWVETFPYQNGEVYNKIKTKNEIIYHLGKLTNAAVNQGEFNTEQIDIADGNSIVTLPGNIMDFDAMGNIIIGGSFQESLDLDKGPGQYAINALKSSDAYVAKYDANLNILWGFGIPGKSSESVRVVAVDKEDNVYVASNFQDSLDIDPHVFGFELPNDPSQYNSFCLSKYSPLGDLLWYKALNGEGKKTIWDIAFDSENNPVIIGGFTEELNYTLGGESYSIFSLGPENGYVAKLSPEGEFLWVNRLGASHDLYALHVRLDSEDRIYTLGSFYENAHLNPTSSEMSVSKGASDSFIQVVDANGHYITHFTYGGTGFDWARGMHLDGENGLILISQAGAELDADLGENEFLITPTDFKSTFIAKYNLCYETSGLQSVSLCDGDSIIINGEEFANSGTYTQVLTNAAGCDSLVTLNVEVNDIVLTSISDSICPGDTLYGYFEEGIYENFDVSQYGCDSITTITLNLLPVSDPQCMPVAINEINTAFEFKISPNPAQGAFRVVSSEPISELSIFDINGVKKKTINTNLDGSIDISSLNTGLYLVQIRVNDMVQTIKLIKK